MSNAFTNFLGGVVSGTFGNVADMKDYQHADRLYVRDTYARAPKFGFLYFVSFNLHPNVIQKGSQYDQKKITQTVGLLVKRVDLPKFNITTDVLNQYNKKTLVPTKITYNNVNFEFHDDNNDIVNSLWINYFQHYFADSPPSEASPDVNPKRPDWRFWRKPRNGGKIQNTTHPVEYTDNKYSDVTYQYGLNKQHDTTFFQSIDIYILHQKKFTQITLINPSVVDWTHDSLDQSESKILSNKMTVAYETVRYRAGAIKKGEQSSAFSAVYYDTQPSPLSIGGNGTKTLFGSGGVIDGAGSLLNSFSDAKSPLDYLGVAIQGNTLLKNARSLTAAGIKTEGYSIASGVLGNIRATGNQPGGIGAAAQAGLNATGSGALGNIGVNLFSSQNSSVNGLTQAVAAPIIKKT